MTPKPNLLIICGKNKRRSRTGEFIFKNDPRFHVRSAGVSPKSDRKISEADLNWADLVLVMESEHRAKIRDLYRNLDLPVIEVLHIPDEYAFMDEELVDLLTERINQSLQARFGI
ncbi:protein-tyrosine-phosphatase [Algoriphagus confluentis]|uniref:Phosphotyrosine protein phosphatase n=1 Tax=Algoriphagus confluentis TaxID=1697556 RepID=A0ABQ6PSH2_9BACT|nr:phosphotyrosine protein phosphatase [Algoriphagus confluentis]